MPVTMNDLRQNWITMTDALLKQLVSVREVSESFESVAVGRRAPLEPIESPVIHFCAPSREVLYVVRREPCPLRPQQAALPQ